MTALLINSCSSTLALVFISTSTASWYKKSKHGRVDIAINTGQEHYNQLVMPFGGISLGSQLFFQRETEEEWIWERGKVGRGTKRGGRRGNISNTEQSQAVE